MKSFERLVLSHLKSLTSPLLDPLQFAYRANRSVDDAINLALHHILQHLDSPGTYARVLFVDFSSAFNTILPSLLQDKLSQLNVPDSTCRWITDFLAGTTAHSLESSQPLAALDAHKPLTAAGHYTASRQIPLGTLTASSQSRLDLPATRSRRNRITASRRPLKAHSHSHLLSAETLSQPLAALERSHRWNAHSSHQPLTLIQPLAGRRNHTASRSRWNAHSRRSSHSLRRPLDASQPASRIAGPLTASRSRWTLTASRQGPLDAHSHSQTADNAHSLSQPLNAPHLSRPLDAHKPHPQRWKRSQSHSKRWNAHILIRSRLKTHSLSQPLEAHSPLAGRWTHTAPWKRYTSSIASQDAPQPHTAADTLTPSPQPLTASGTRSQPLVSSPWTLHQPPSAVRWSAHKPLAPLETLTASTQRPWKRSQPLAEPADRSHPRRSPLTAHSPLAAAGTQKLLITKQPQMPPENTAVR
uniref:Reverse transcriptase domain-containing protein n=1 Tax=Knipowitschia caucasica TaxID=637954 RepID=A0AAV2LG33_KNICA